MATSKPRKAAARKTTAAKVTETKAPARARTAKSKQDGPDLGPRTIGNAMDDGGRPLVDDGGRPILRTEADLP